MKQTDRLFLPDGTLWKPSSRPLSDANRKSGRRWLIALCIAIAGTMQALGQNVSLGTSVFTNTSDQPAAAWYWPLPDGVTHLYDGYGDFAGATRTETYTRGEWIAGVKTVRWHTETKFKGLAMPEVEDWWLAFDAANNLCLLKIVQGGRVAFTASAQVNPLVWLPGKPVVGQQWDLLGITLTIKEVAASLHAGSALKLGIGMAGRPVRHKTYNAGIGVVQDAVSESPRPAGSGWRPQME